MPNPHNQTITTTNGKAFKANDHGALARLVYQRFGENLTAATNAWKRMLQNSATESDFAEILTWKDVEDYKAPTLPPDLYIQGKQSTRNINAKTLRDYLVQVCPYGNITKVKINEFTNNRIQGTVTVESIQNGKKNHRFHVHMEHEYQIIRAFGKSKRVR